MKINSHNLIRCALLAAALLAAPALCVAQGTSATGDSSGPVTCKDGTTAAHGGRGACHGHGGIDKSATAGGGSTGGSSTSAASTPAASSAGTASTSAPSSAASTGPVTCKDGTTSPHGGRGACRGHGGINKSASASGGASGTTGTGSASAPASTKSASGTAAEAPAVATSSAPAPAAKSAPAAQAAPGGGPGKVWVNTASHVYHCANDRWYGKTKQGEYMTEAAAKAAGARPDHGKACSD
jgi:hypothetical protein